MASYKYTSPRLSADELAARVAKCAVKIAWFMERGYQPHYYQLLYHTDRGPDGLLRRFRHLVAGRRGGKTLSAAWETAYYFANPEQYWLDFKGIESDEPLWMWMLAENNKYGRPALIAFRKVMRQAGYIYGKDYTENKGDKFFMFGDTLLEFKSADDPDALRGAGLHWVWMDEAGYIRTKLPWEVVQLSLSDNEGALSTTTTPRGKNWLFDEFWSAEALADEAQMRVEYRSIDNPHYSKNEWLRLKKTMHPLVFKREMMAAFDSMDGVEFPGEWLHYYTEADLPREDTTRPNRGTWEGYGLDKYIGIDPATSMSAAADRFAITLVGVDKATSKAYMLEQWAGKLPFPDQIVLINEWYLKYQPRIIGCEAQAYQAALVQQFERIQTLAPIVPVFAKGKKTERLMAMSPMFKIGKVLIRADHRDFIDEWISYDPALRNPKDDCLDSAEIALRTAGALLPILVGQPDKFDALFDDEPASLNEAARRDRLGIGMARESKGVNEYVGADW